MAEPRLGTFSSVFGPEDDAEAVTEEPGLSQRNRRLFMLKRVSVDGYNATALLATTDPQDSM